MVQAAEVVVCLRGRQHSSAYVIRQHTSADVSIRMPAGTSADDAVRSIRQHTSAYVSMRMPAGTSAGEAVRGVARLELLRAHATQPQQQRARRRRITRLGC